MKTFLSNFIMGIIIFMGYPQWGYATVKCLCQDKTMQAPDCGICGSQLGTTEKTDVGVACICYNKLKSQEITCSEVCEHHGGWTGEFSLD